MRLRVPRPEPWTAARREAPGLRSRIAVGLLVGLLLLVGDARLGDGDVLRALELQTLDWRFRWRGPLPPGGATVLVLLDDATVARIGAWPLPRELMATAVARIAAAGARVIVLNLLLAETQADLPPTVRTLLGQAQAALPDSAAHLRRAIGEVLATSGPDTALAAAIGASGRVVAPYAFVLDRFQANAVTVPDWIATTAYRIRTGPNPTPLLIPQGLLVPAAPFAAAAASAGHVTLLLEPDGSLRADLPGMPYAGELYPSLAVEAARLQLEAAPAQVVVDGGRGLAIGDRTVPMDGTGRQLVNYYGPDGTIPTYSLLQLLRGAIDAEALAGRVVVLGASAAGAGDRFATPFTGRLPGSEFLATAIDNILTGRSLIRNAATRAVDAAGILALALAAALLAGRRSPLISLSTIALILAAWTAAAQAAFTVGQIWLAALTPWVAAIAAGIGVEGLRLADERRRRRWLQRQRANLGRYFAPAVVDRLAASDAPTRLDRTQDAAVMFVDIVGFTRRSESLAPAEAMALLRAFHVQVEQAVFAHDGMVDKFIGDGALACFGVPEPSATAAADAIRSALALLAALDARPAAARLQVGIGIHYGPVLMGDIGGATQFQFTVVGDTVNVASRLEALTRQHATPLLVSAPAIAVARRHLVPELLCRFETLPELPLRGREGGIGAVRLLA